MSLRIAAVLLALIAATPAYADLPEKRERLRDLGIDIGQYQPGKWNAITDVSGVKVGHATVFKGSGKLVPGKGPARTGVTAIVPRDDVWHKKVFAGSSVLNGNGEMTALSWVREAGWLETPILLTDTLSVGKVADAMVTWMAKKVPEMGIEDDVVLPLVAECDDSFLNDQQGRHVTQQDVMAALDGARSGPVPEGAVGAGTGMNAYRFKAGIGTSSRKLPAKEGGWTVGVLVNANMGQRHELEIDGVPVGREIQDLQPVSEPPEGSIIVVVATDAPLLPHQLDRIARRAGLGIGRTGSPVHHGSGDFIIAFSTATIVPHYPDEATMSAIALNNTHLDELFQATIEATQEAIGNALAMATTTEGRDGHKMYALPLDRLPGIMKKYGRGPAGVKRPAP